MLYLACGWDVYIADGGCSESETLFGIVLARVQMLDDGVGWIRGEICAFV